MESAKVQKNQKVYFSKKRKIQKKYKVKKVGRYGESSWGKQGGSASFAAQTRGMGACSQSKMGGGGRDEQFAHYVVPPPMVPPPVCGVPHSGPQRSGGAESPSSAAVTDNSAQKCVHVRFGTHAYQISTL